MALRYLADGKAPWSSRTAPRPPGPPNSSLGWASIRLSEVGIPAHWGLAPNPDYTVPATPQPSNLRPRRESVSGDRASDFRLLLAFPRSLRRIIRRRRPHVLDVAGVRRPFKIHQELDVPHPLLPH